MHLHFETNRHGQGLLDFNHPLFLASRVQISLKMIGLKKFVSNELLQIALLLSIIRHRSDPLINSNIEFESPTVGVGGRSEWNQSNVYVSHNPIHPKSIVNYPEDLIHELNSLGRYNRIDFSSDVTAYLLNVNETVGHSPVPSGGEGGALPSQPAASSTEASNEAEDDAKGVELSKEVRASVFYILLQL